MSRPPKLRPLPESERRQTLTQFLTVLDEHEGLAHFRAAVPSGPERQLALFAALERSVFRGRAAVAPPNPDDQLDQLLCDILDVIDRHPDLKNHGSYYGPDRHRANLQALGAWTGQPLAAELFATTFSYLTPGASSTLPASESNSSPVAPVSAQNGELIASENSPFDAANESTPLPQTHSTEDLAFAAACQSPLLECSQPSGIIRHECETSGEQLNLANPSGLQPIPARPLRRGRPAALDDLAKGRLLGLMSYGLSFRQAAAQLGVHHQTLLNAMKRDEQFAQQVAETRLDAISQPLLTVVQAARKNWRTAAWLAKYLNDRRTSSYESTPEEYELAKKRT